MTSQEKQFLQKQPGGSRIKSKLSKEKTFFSRFPFMRLILFLKIASKTCHNFLGK